MNGRQPTGHALRSSVTGAKASSVAVLGAGAHRPQGSSLAHPSSGTWGLLDGVASVARTRPPRGTVSAGPTDVAFFASATL